MYYVYLQKFTFVYNYCDRLSTTTYEIFKFCFSFVLIDKEIVSGLRIV